jgi:hypothetical protein
MTAKVRVEFVTLAPVGAAGGVETDMPNAFFAAQEISATGLTPSSTAAAPTFGTVAGNPVTAGVARVIGLSGNAIVAVGFSPAPASDTAGDRIAPGQIMDFPITTGAFVAICEATD